MACIPASGSINFCKAVAPIVNRSYWLVEKVKELFRKIIAFFFPYTKVDLETRLSRLVKMNRAEDITSSLDFEISHLAKKSRDGLEELYRELKKFQAALVHACAMKKLDPQKAAKIYEQLLQRFSEGDLLEAAFVEVRKYNKLAYEVSNSLREQKILSDKRVDDFTTDLMSKVAAKEKKDELAALLGKIISEQGDLFLLFQNLKKCYQEKEKLLSGMSTKGLDKIDQDIERFSEAILLQRKNEQRFRSLYEEESKEGLDLESSKEIERLEIEKDVQGAWCDEIEEKMSQLKQQYEGFVLKKASFIRAHFVKRLGIFSLSKKIRQRDQDIAQYLQRFLSGVKTRNN